MKNNRLLTAIAWGLGLGTLLIFVVTIDGLLRPRITISINGQKQTVRIHPPLTVAEILAQNNIALERGDQVDPNLDERIALSSTIKVTRVEAKILVSTTSNNPIIKFQEVSKRNLRPVRLQKGKVGKHYVKTKVIIQGGTEVARTVISEWDANRETYELVFLDPKKGAELEKYDLTTTPKIRLLAACYSTDRSKADANTPAPPGDRPLKRGLITADPSDIALGTRLYIPGYGYAYTFNAGASGEDKRVELPMETQGDCELWGTRWVTAHVLGTAPNY